MKIEKKKGLEPTSRALQYCALLAVVYVLLLFLLPASSATMREYHLTALEYRVAAFAVAIPSLLTWFAAFIGYAKLREYAHSVRKTPEGISYDQLAGGVTWLAWSLPVGVLIPQLLNALAGSHPGFRGTATIVSNYIALLMPLIGFSVIANASQGLLASIRAKLSLANARFIILAFLVLGVLYCFLVFRNLNLSSLGSSNNPYYLPAWLLVISVIVPYLYTWFMGLLGSYEITVYRTHIRGVLYKQALGLVVGGLITVILSSMALQYVTSVQPRIGHLVFNDRLLFITLFQIIGGVGFVLLGIGASRLKKIEEV
jgi:hypothetical protein